MSINGPSSPVSIPDLHVNAALANMFLTTDNGLSSSPVNKTSGSGLRITTDSKPPSRQQPQAAAANMANDSFLLLNSAEDDILKYLGNISGGFESVSSKSRLLKKSIRSANHISQYFRINTVLPNGENMKITINKNLRVEDLARQIEAEHWLAFAYPKLAYSKSASETDKTRVMEGIKWGLNPIYVEQIFDGGMLPLKFSALISEYLDFGDRIFVLTSEEVDNNTSEDVGLPFAEVGPSSPVSPVHADYGFDNEVVDANFYQVLHHELGLKYFNEFCLEEYTVENLLFWIDVEIFKTCDSSIRFLFSKCKVIFENMGGEQRKESGIFT